MSDLEACPFCGKAWPCKNAKKRSLHVELIMDTVLPVTVSTVIVFLLRALGI